MEYSSGRGYGCRITQYTHRSLTHLCLENESLRVTVLADKGADIVEFLHKPSDTDFMWKARGGIREPGKAIPTIASDLGGNLDFYEGGWHECLPGGGPAVIAGAQQGLHGEAALLPWQWTVEADESDCVRVRMSCRLIRLPLVLTKSLCLRSGSASLEIEESLANESGVDFELLWGQHPTFGAPFLDEHCRIDVPAKRFRGQPGFRAPSMLVDPGSEGDWPRCVGRDGRALDLSRPAAQGSGIAGLLCLDVEEGWYAITNARTRVGFGLRWDAKLFPHLYYWHVFNGIPDYPWYGTAYVVGLEPWTSYPMSHDAAVAAGSALKLGAHETISTTFTALAFAGRESVTRITAEGGVE
jgi:hypothetical protein